MYEAQKRYYKRNRKRIISRSKQYYQEHKKHLTAKRKEYRHTQVFKDKFKEKLKVQDKLRRQRLKSEALTHYGNGVLACIKCGYSDIRALCLDHINGNNERGKERIAGSRLYRRLRKQGFPMGYQTLCANCNYIKEFEVDLKKAKYPNSVQ